MSKPLNVPEFGALKFGAVGVPTIEVDFPVTVPTLVPLPIVKIIVTPTPVFGLQSVHSSVPFVSRFRSPSVIQYVPGARSMVRFLSSNPPQIFELLAYLVTPATTVGTAHAAGMPVVRKE